MNEKNHKLLLNIFMFFGIIICFLSIAIFADASNQDIYLYLIPIVCVFLFGFILSILMFRVLRVTGTKDNKELFIQPQKVTNIEEPDANSEEVASTCEHSTNIDNKKYDIDIRDIQTTFLKTEERLTLEIKSLGKRANLNLIIGSAIAVIGWGVLVWFIFELRIKEYFGWQLLNAFVPRLTMVIMIETFSFFFLKLYRESIDRIKYYQNEITNVELKKIAVQTLCLEGQSTKQSTLIIEKLISTERNALLKNGDSTIELEKLKIDSYSTMNIVKSLQDLGVLITNNPQK